MWHRPIGSIQSAAAVAIVQLHNFGVWKVGEQARGVLIKWGCDPTPKVGVRTPLPLKLRLCYYGLNDPFCCIHRSRDSIPTPKIAISCGLPQSPSDTWFLGSTQVSPPRRKHLDRLTCVPNKQTHLVRQTHTPTTLRATSVVNRPHVYAMHAMRPNNNNNKKKKKKKKKKKTVKNISQTSPRCGVCCHYVQQQSQATWCPLANIRWKFMTTWCSTVSTWTTSATHHNGKLRENMNVIHKTWRTC